MDSFVFGLQSSDPNVLALCLAPRVKLSVPPLRIHVQGAAEVAAALWEVISAFDHLTYSLRSRFLTPGTVTDEAVLTGVHVRGLLGASPTGRLGSVPVRVIAHHDGALITSVDVWPDVAAVRGLCDELAAHIDRRRAGAAGAMISELRATIPSGTTRVTTGQAREYPSTQWAPPTAFLPDDLGSRPSMSAAERAARGGYAVLPAPNRRPPGPKARAPRRVRQIRAFASGTTMLVASAAIITWIAAGALRPSPSAVIEALPAAAMPSTRAAAAAPSPRPTAAASPRPTTAPPSPSGIPSGSPSAVTVAPAPSASPQAPVQIVDNQAIFSSDVLFASGRSTLTSEARIQLRLLIREIREQNRQGAITVHGFTDNVGSDAVNLALSRARAAAVATVLSRGLPDAQVVSQGYGDRNPAATNSTPEGRAQNRRVAVALPSPAS